MITSYVVLGIAAVVLLIALFVLHRARLWLHMAAQHIESAERTLDRAKSKAVFKPMLVTPALTAVSKGTERTPARGA